ncbi:MAG: L,D-transpeptidase [Verrucomicrobiota bacterium]|nr:L,D-transpeptidase [Verrucomicrobiota bacterium]
MRFFSRFLVAASLPAAFFLTSCGTTGVGGGGNYRVTAHRPHNPSDVRVKVSLARQNVYVMEGNRCLMAVATTIGIPAKPTPRGNFTIYSKQEHKRSGSYGFRVQGDHIVPAEASKNIPGRYVGYPMGYWCEFSPSYGFHQGYVHMVPRSHGCLRLKGEAAAKFFALVHNGTPVNIAETQPEDLTFGKQVQRIDDSKTPDPPMSVSISDKAFQAPSGALLED